MKISSKAVAMAFSALSLGGCAEVILNSNLNQFQDMAFLDFFEGGPIPGLPEGDAIGQVFAPASVQTDPVPGISGRAMQINGRVQLNTADHSQPEIYQVAWVGLRDNQAPTPTRITLRDEAGDVALRIEFEPQGISIVSGTITGLAPAPYSTTVAHVVSIVIRPGQPDGVDVKITQGDTVLLDRARLEVLDPDFDTLDEIVFDSQSSAGTYYAQEVRVLKRD